jgi:WD40 repeat protein
VRIWSGPDLARAVASTEAVPGGVNQVVFTGGNELVTANSDGTVRFWHLDGKESRPPLPVDPDGDVVFAVAVTPDGYELAAATATDDVTLWDLRTRRLRAELNGQPPVPLAVAFTDDGDALVSANNGGIVTLWNAATGEGLGPRFEYHDGRPVRRVAIDAHGVVTSAGEDGKVVALNALDLREACHLAEGAFDVRARTRFLGDREPEGCPE